MFQRKITDVLPAGGVMNKASDFFQAEVMEVIANGNVEGFRLLVRTSPEKLQQAIDSSNHFRRFILCDLMDPSRYTAKDMFYTYKIMEDDECGNFLRKILPGARQAYLFSRLNHGHRGELAKFAQTDRAATCEVVRLYIDRQRFFSNDQLMFVFEHFPELKEQVAKKIVEVTFGEQLPDCGHYRKFFTLLPSG